MQATYARMNELLKGALSNFDIISGDVIGTKSWQETAAETSEQLRLLSEQLLLASQGSHEPFMVFPSPWDFYEPSMQEV